MIWLICKKKFIKISLKQRTEDEVVPVPTSPETARIVRLFVEDTLKDLLQQFQYLGRLRYEFCVACPYCLQGSQECENHHQTLCTHQDCLHLLEIKQGERLICMKSVIDKVLTVAGLEKWYPESTSQVRLIKKNIMYFTSNNTSDWNLSTAWVIKNERKMYHLPISGISIPQWPTIT